MFESKRDAAVAIMMAQLNDPYVWGGNATLQDGGVDCSGSIRFVLDELRIIPHGSDYASWQFAEMFPETRELKEGVLVFYLRGPKIGHVEMVAGKFTSEWWTIGAAGGGSQTDTIEEAQAADARVKMHPIPANWVKAVDPFAAEEV